MTRFTPGREMDEAVGKAIGLNSWYRFSTQNAEAITAIELLIKDELAAGVNITFCLENLGEPKWISEIFIWPNEQFSPRQVFEGVGKTPAEAICHSILKYRGIETDEV